MPGDEAAVAVPYRLRKGVPQRGLRPEIHLAEEQLAEEIGWHRGGFFAFLLVGLHGVVRAPVEQAHG